MFATHRIQLMSMAGNSRTAFADLQGFIVEDDRFILKELCFTIWRKGSSNNANTYNPPISHHYIFDAPFGWNQLSEKSRASAKWLTNFHHGLHWSQGGTTYNRVSECVAPLLQQDTNLLIYVKGEHKVEWLRRVCNRYINCQNIEEIGCDISLRGESIGIVNDTSYILLYHCRRHNNSANLCALQNCKIIEDWHRDSCVSDDNEW